MLRTTLAVLALAPAAFAQFNYDFNSLNGTDTHPFTQLDGQDGWTEQTFNARNRCGVTATLSFDGTPALRFQEVGPGYGCDASRINDASWSYPTYAGTEVNAYFQADMKVGYWGGSFGLGHDTNVSGAVRGAENGELGVRFMLGTQANVQCRLYAADGTHLLVPLANLGSVSGGDWVRVRVIMDLSANSGAGLGSVQVQNLTAGATEFTSVVGLQDVPLMLNPAAADATNPSLWDAVWLHFEGATYGLDNIEVGRGVARSLDYGTGCGNPALGLRGVARPVIGTTASAETFAIPSLSPAGFVLLGFSPIEPGFDLVAIGMPGCALRVMSDGTLGFTPAGPTAQHTLSIPSTPALAGGSIYLQSAVVAVGANPLGVITSNGVRWLIDMR